MKGPYIDKNKYIFQTFSISISSLFFFSFFFFFFFLPFTIIISIIIIIVIYIYTDRYIYTHRSVINTVHLTPHVYHIYVA